MALRVFPKVACVLVDNSLAFLIEKLFNCSGYDLAPEHDVLYCAGVCHSQRNCQIRSGTRCFLSLRPAGINGLVASSFPYTREDSSSLGGRAVVSRNGCPCLYFPVIRLPNYIRCGSSLDPRRRHEGILQVTILLSPSAWLIRSTCKV